MPLLPDFQTLRQRFMTAAEQRKGVVTSYPHSLPGPQSEPLYTDVVVIGNPAAQKLRLIISGTHGIEGYYGSESQSDWLEFIGQSPLPDDTAIVLVHLINPWGTAYLRRVNEDNIDLNRHFVDFSQPLPENPEYPFWHDVYHGDRYSADSLLSEKLATYGWQTMQKIVEAGQYQSADGIFYGGQQPGWSYRIMETILRDHLSEAKVILSFDLHTGAGAWGHPMLLSIAEQPVAAHQWGKAVYGEWLTLLLTGPGRQSDTGVAASATGYLSQFLINSLPETCILPLVVECGTYAGEDMHRRVRDDHWLHLQDYSTSPTSDPVIAIKQQLAEGFWPADPDWRSLTAFRTRQIFERGWKALAAK